MIRAAACVYDERTNERMNDWKKCVVVVPVCGASGGVTVYKSGKPYVRLEFFLTCTMIGFKYDILCDCYCIGDTTRAYVSCRRRLLCATRIDRLYRDDEYDVYDDVYDDACDDDDDGGCREHRGNRTHHFDDAKSAQ